MVVTRFVMETIYVDHDSPELDDEEFQRTLFEPRPDRTVVFRTSRAMRRLTWAFVGITSLFVAGMLTEVADEAPLMWLAVPSQIYVAYVQITFSRSHLTIDHAGVRYLGGLEKRATPWAAITDIAVEGKELRLSAEKDLDPHPASFRYYPTTIVMRSGKIEPRLRAPDQFGKTFPQFMAAVTRTWWRDALQRQGGEA